MTDFTVLIGRESRMLARLHEEIHRSFRERGKGAAARQRWQDAGAAFRSYRSPMAPHVDAAMRAERYDEPTQRAFVLRFLELDPRYFGSGYAKEAMLPRLARTALDVGEGDRVRAILLDAAERRGGREFRRYCRVAEARADETLRAALDRIAATKPSDPARSSRCRMMSAYVQRGLRQPAFGASGVRP